MNIIRHLVFSGALACLFGCGQGRTTAKTDVPNHTHSVNYDAVRKFCGDCHAFPEPSTFPTELWPAKVDEGFEFYHLSGRKDLAVPDRDAIVAFYSQAAPEALEVKLPINDENKENNLFQTAESIKLQQPLRAVATIQAVRQNISPERRGLFISDMRSGWIWKSQQQKADQVTGFTPWLELLSPARVTPVELRPGIEGFLICDLGSFFPEDHALGRVVYAESDVNSPESVKTTDILIGVGRVADARPFDADNDGDVDVIVAEFGWRKTGSVQLLRNTPNKSGDPVFVSELIDSRHGAIHVPVMDLDNDGDEDFVALVSQEFETVVAYLNRGDGTFEAKIIFEANNPSFGSSGLEPADIDNDGDIDFAYVNGDSLDTPIAKPYHGVQWLENTGRFPFTRHVVAEMPGAHCVRVADIDQDGDQDLAVSALLPAQASDGMPVGSFDSVVWFEQQADSTFRRHRVEADTCQHAACELFDWDADGDLDIITGDLARDADADRPLTIFRNRLLR